MNAFCTAFKGIPIDLSCRAIGWLYFRFDTFRKVGITYAADHLLTGKSIIYIIIKNDPDIGKAKGGCCPKVRLLLNRIERRLQWYGHKLFYFLRAPPRPLRDNDDLGIGNIGEGFYRRI